MYYLNATLTGVTLYVPTSVPTLEDHIFSLSLTFNETFQGTVPMWLTIFQLKD